MNEQTMEIVEFSDLRGDNVSLSPEIVNRFIVGDNGTVTPAEYKFFVELCKARKLNPFLKEAYCIKYGTQPATIVVSKDVYLQRADSFPDYDGKSSGLIVQNKTTGAISEREGCFYAVGQEDLLGAWCKVYRKGRSHPEYMSVSFAEAAQRKKDGSLNSNWVKQPATMCEKVAVVRALRAAFPQEFSQMYIENEMPDNSPVTDEVQGQYVDTTNTYNGAEIEEFACCECGKLFAEWKRSNGEVWSAKQVYELACTKSDDGKARCSACQKERKERMKANYTESVVAVKPADETVPEDDDKPDWLNDEPKEEANNG